WRHCLAAAHVRWRRCRGGGPHYQHVGKDVAAAPARAAGGAACHRARDAGRGRDHALAALLGAGRNAAAEHCSGMVGATMNHNPGILLALAGNFALMSLFAMGGANAALPEMHRLAVEVMHWMTDRQFADLYAIAQVTPGPNVIVVTLIGYHVAGLAGALVATLAMCGPTCVFAFFLGQGWDRFKEARWRLVISAAPIPRSLGPLGAPTLVIARVAGQSWQTLALMLLTAVVTYRLRLNPLWIFAFAAVLGLAGAV